MFYYINRGKMKNILIVDMQRGFVKDNNKHLIDSINKYLADMFDKV